MQRSEDRVRASGITRPGFETLVTRHTSGLIGRDLSSASTRPSIFAATVHQIAAVGTAGNNRFIFR